jgi:peptide/nickel transport system ATP-binding protein
MTALLQISNLHVHFQTPSGIVKANNGVNLEVHTGNAVGIMGESGCGKTVLFLTLLRLQQPGKIVMGSIEYNGQDIVRMPEGSMYQIRGRQIGLIPQNQATALNPAYTVEQHLSEVLRLREGNSDLWSQLTIIGALRPENMDEVEKLFGELGLGDAFRIRRLLKSYPHQLSGGMRQRILTAMALLLRPRLLIADEPTTALDRATRLLSLELLKEIKIKATLMLVSHDIEAITNVCDYVAVMYSGRVIERGHAKDILSGPHHPYTKILLSCQKFNRGTSLPDLVIDTQDLINLPSGCSFHPFCPEARPVCSKKTPVEYNFGTVKVSCHQYTNEVLNA